MNLADQMTSLKKRKRELIKYFALRKEVEDMEKKAQAEADRYAVRIRPEANQILALVCVHFRVNREQLSSHLKTSDIVVPRHVYFYLARMLTRQSAATIGDLICHDHGTVLYAVTAIQNRIETEPQFAALIEDLKARCEAAINAPPDLKIA